MITEDKVNVIITEAFTKKKFLNVGYLITEFNRGELDVILHHSVNFANNLNQCIIDRAWNDFGMTHFEAFALKSFIESQLMFLKKAINHMGGNFDYESIEGEVIEFVLQQN